MVILNGFPAESGYHVRSQSTVRNHTPYLLDPFHVPLSGVFSPHLFQHNVAAALDRQMDVLAYVLIPCHSVDDFIADVLRVGG